MATSRLYRSHVQVRRPACLPKKGGLEAAHLPHTQDRKLKEPLNYVAAATNEGQSKVASALEAANILRPRDSFLSQPPGCKALPAAAGADGEPDQALGPDRGAGRRQPCRALTLGTDAPRGSLP